MSRISILGCGWLGLPLGTTLVKNGYTVSGSTTSADKLPQLAQAGMDAFLLSLTAAQTMGNAAAFLDQSDILIIAIPPRNRSENAESFTDKMRNLIAIVEKSSVSRVLFISSTSVYGANTGQISEHTVPVALTVAAKELLAVEAMLLNSSKFKTTVLRFGGLIGPDRHPARFLAGKKNIENPAAAVNLIHRDDCIGIIHKIIARACWGVTYNAVAPLHESRESYYTSKAALWQLPAPEFKSGPSIGKTILSDKLVRELQYEFQIPDL